MKLCDEFWVILFLLGVLVGASKKDDSLGHENTVYETVRYTTTQGRSDQEVASVFASSSSSGLGMF